MISKAILFAAGALSALQPVFAQTFTECNPLEKKCPDNPALGTTLSVDFTKGPTDFFELVAGTNVDKYDSDLGAVFTIDKEISAPTIASKKYIFFGSVSVVTRAAPGTGIISSIVLQSADLDEIDWEWLGGNSVSVQTNYFGKGDTSTYDRSGTHGVANPQATFHNYTIDWTPDYLRWYIDGAMVREVTYAAAKGGATFPQSPCQLKLGSWVGGKASNGAGTVAWAGGLTDFSQGPFHTYYKSIVVSDYHKGATSYVWPEVPAGGRGDGSWKSIKVIYDGSSPGSTSTSKSSIAPSSTLATSSSDIKTSISSSATSITSTTSTVNSVSTTSTSALNSTSITVSTSRTSSSSSSASRTSTAPAATSTTAAPNSGMVLGQNLFNGLLFVMGTILASLAL